MLCKELVIGFVVAGFADAAVPVDVWRTLFLTGHGFWSSLENVAPRALPRAHDGTTYSFCSDHCRHRFDADPEAVFGGSARHP